MTRFAFRWLLRGSLFPAIVALGSCGDSTGPRTPDVELQAVSGGGQFGVPGTTLESPFEVKVRSRSSQKPREDATVEWTVVEGSGASLSARSTVTDASGRARSTLTLGETPGSYRVRAALQGGGATPVHFVARGVAEPVLTAISGSPAAPGDTVDLEGSNFIPEVDEMVVTFDGVRGAAVDGSDSSLRVRVPACLPPGPVEVVVALGELRSEPREARVEGVGPTLELAPGEVHTVDDPRGLSCVRLPSSTDARYLANVHSTSTIGAASFDYGLALRVGEQSSTSSALPAAMSSPGQTAPTVGEAWEWRIRALEREALARRLGPAAPARVPAPVRVPDVGDTRTFQVLDGEGGFQEVTAEVRHVGQRAIIYVDRQAPDGGFEEGDLATMGGEFDDPIHPVVTDVYGAESDLDGNGRVVILFTPVVNGFTERGSSSFVGGFFFGVDLLEKQEGSNGGEVFYALVPDPDGEFGDPRSRHRVLSTVPAILAHEFQHMVHFNQRVLLRGAASTDALWLSEALATDAEDLVARELAERGRTDRSWEFREGNYIRAIRFLEDPGGTSLVVSAGQGSLAERGAGWLFLRYLEGRTGGTAVLGALTRTTRTGVANVEAETGLGWPELVSDWSSAVFLDGEDTPVPETMTFRGFDLLGELRKVEAGFSPGLPTLGAGRLTRVRSIRPSASDPVLLQPAASRGLAVNLAGPLGGPAAPGAELRLRLVRLR